jgi:hypothetical protein
MENKEVLVGSKTKSIQKSVSWRQRSVIDMGNLIKPNDSCSIEVPYEMSCDGNLNPAIDGLNCTIESIEDEEATVTLVDSKETHTVPLFCLKKRNLKVEALNKILSESPSKSTSSKRKKTTKTIRKEAHFPFSL